jgi:hypothetical protein
MMKVRVVSIIRHVGLIGHQIFIDIDVGQP